MTALQDLLNQFRQHAKTEREKGTYFEDLTRCYLQHEPVYRDLYGRVETFANWANRHGRDGSDTGIDLVATVRGSGEVHAVQCKLRAEDYLLQRGDLDSFLSASSQEPFAHRVFVSTTSNWGENAKKIIEDQRPPISRIDCIDLEKSQIDWSRYHPEKRDAIPVLKTKKTPLPHQEKATADVLEGLQTAERGKMIMACGTGKTFVSLKIAEKLAGKGGKVLFLVPSLALLSQALTEWTQQSAISLRSFAVCSDSQTGKKKKQAVAADDVELMAHELSYPATTDAEKVATEIAKRGDPSAMTTVFGTYQSIEVVGQAQREHDLEDFDLIICDEAHRTTGETHEGEDESHFVRVHDQDFIKGGKRLYMTATPDIYSENVQTKAKAQKTQLSSMDDACKYGKDLHTLSFSDAVRQNLLVDYKVLVLAVEEAHASRSLQALLSDADNQLKVDDAGKIVGCWKALAKQDLEEDLGDDTGPMRRAVAFCQRIEYLSGKSKNHQVGSKNIAGMFQQVVEAYQQSEKIEQSKQLTCEAEHVDGSMGAIAKEEKLQWLKDVPPAESTCRILSNVRCLSEGVDVPALDAVLFLTPRDSQIEVVQSVGRVMRKAPGKTRGYIILPVVIPAQVEPHEALNDNKTYKVVWQVLQALRSHDDRFDAMVNKLELAGKDVSKMEIILVRDKLRSRPANTAKGSPGKGKHVIGKTSTSDSDRTKLEQGVLEISEIERAIYAKMVQKVGNRHYFEEWAGVVAKIANTHIDRIQGILENPANQKEVMAFEAFADHLRKNMNESIHNDEIVEMLAQHLITKPVFDTLFTDFAFADSNPVSQAMKGVLEALGQHNIDKEADNLQGFYDSVQLRVEGISDPQAKQKIVVELYDKFFRNAFPKTTQRLGLVYTPVELVDFIIHSINHILQKEFGKNLGSEKVHILDPFTGTGTFITRLLQSGLLSKEELIRKYGSELHANEIVLLAYYIAAINIEAAYHSKVQQGYQPFEGVVLTDTFENHDGSSLFGTALQANNERRLKQEKMDIRAIISNPPYSKGQKSANDEAANLDYKELDDRIRATYADKSNAKLVHSLYDSYIRAFRWASDRVGDSGIIGFVTNAGWLDSRSTDGLRKCLAEEFSSIYVFNLRGNQRTQGEMSRKEGGKIFGSGSRTPIAISILVKNPDAKERGQIFYHDIGDYLSREEKLEKITSVKSIAGISEASVWKHITPDEHGDWLNQRDSQFDRHIAMGDKDDNELPTIFHNYSMGIVTSRDAWCYNASKEAVAENMQRMIDFYNEQRKSFRIKEISDTDNDPAKISWSRALRSALGRNKAIDYSTVHLTPSLYRPFTKQWLYFNRQLNEMVYQMPRIFPSIDAGNLVICVSGKGAAKDFSVLMADSVPETAFNEKAQCFPLYLYEPSQLDGGEVRDEPAVYRSLLPGQTEHDRQDAITDEGLQHFRQDWPEEAIDKVDLFYYTYGILHSRDYRQRYAANLSKELPRIPRVSKVEDFRKFSEAGRKLAGLHINYESVKKYPVTIEGLGLFTEAEDYRVKKMRYGKNGSATDRTKLIYNDKITLRKIPLEAYTYVVNGKPALDWVVERQRSKTHKPSGIVNDANNWAIGNPRYPLELFQRIITVSLETMKIVRSLPSLDL